MSYIKCLTYRSRILILAGTALINPTSLLLLLTLTPQCQFGFQQGGLKALKNKKTLSPETLIHVTEMMGNNIKTEIDSWIKLEQFDSNIGNGAFL